MKKYLIVLLVGLGLQTQAQTSLCDQTYTTGNQSQLEIAIPVSFLNFYQMAPLYASTTYANQFILGYDSCFANACTHTISSTLFFDTIRTCITYWTETTTDLDTLTCCFEQYWDTTSESWVRVNDTDSPVGIEELTFNEIQSNKIYDLQGRELDRVPTNTAYIRNRKLFIRIQ